MFIKFYCKNGHYYEIEELKLLAEPQNHRYCCCGEKLSIFNLNDIMENDINIRAEKYINEWIKELGIEGCIELIERNKDQSCYRIYKEILEKRGFKLKGETK